MKKALSLILLLALLALPLISCVQTKTEAPSVTETPTAVETATKETTTPAESAKTTPSGATETTAETTVTEVPTVVDPGETNIYTPLAPADNGKKEHQKLDYVPVSATLVGSDTLPQIDSQGGIGCCASNAITYLQYTNAVAQYLKHNGGLGDFSPSIDYSQCFSPKFTYQYAGASTSNVYDVLLEQGALTNAVDGFAKSPDGGSQSKLNGRYQQQTLKWSVYEGWGEEALAFRILDYSQTFVTNNPLYTAEGKKGVAMTTSEAGRAMIERIKEAVASGNVVVTGGYPNTWQSQRMTRSTGTLGKSGDYVITFSTADRSGGHQVCIVGYDDEIEVTANGITMKGAFLIANSWGKSWGRNGYMWVMYDALNSESEFDGFRMPANLKGQERDWTLDQFCFIYWDSDITSEKPVLYAEAELATANRDAFTMEISRTDASGETVKVTPYIFDYVGMHEKYEVSGYLNADGEINGEATDGFYTVTFTRLFDVIPEGVTYRDYIWALRILSNSSDFPVTLKSLKLKDSNGSVLCALDFGEGETFVKATRTYQFSFAESGGAKSFLSGKYRLENVASGKYLAKDGVMNLKMTNANKADKFVFKFDAQQNVYKFLRDDEKYIVEPVDGLTDGSLPRFNAEDPVKRAETQSWHVSYNEDGTYCFYLTDASGDNYALAYENDAIVMKRATEVTDTIKWNAYPDGTSGANVSVKANGSDLTVSGKLKDSADSVKIVVTDASGKQLAEKTAAVDGKAFSETLTVNASGALLVKILKDDGTPAAAYCAYIK